MLHKKFLWDNATASESPLTTPFQHGLGGGIGSDEFCNFPKPTIRHLQPLHAVIGQLCGGEKGWVSYLFSFITQLFLTFFICTTKWSTVNALQESLSENMCHQLSPYLNDIMSPPSLCFSLRLRVAIRRNYKHFWFLAWLEVVVLLFCLIQSFKYMKSTYTQNY